MFTNYGITCYYSMWSELPVNVTNKYNVGV